MKLFVTGGTGFIGSHFLEQALAAGHDVVALRRQGSHTRRPLMRQPVWIDGPLDGDYQTAMAGCEVLVHLASHTPNPPYDSLENCLYWNVVAAVRLHEQARGAGITRFLCAGSCFEYGRSAERYERIPVDAPLMPTLSYPTSKAAASIAFAGFAAQHGVQFKIYRIFQVYGEGEQATRLWPSLRAAAQRGDDFPMTEGEQVRDFIEVGEVARAFVRGLDFDGVVPGVARVANLGSGQEQTLAQFAQYWWGQFGATGQLIRGAVPYRFNETMHLVPQIDPTSF
jgi:nucleoside-diphosphate-sugar epimerase